MRSVLPLLPLLAILVAGTAHADPRGLWLTASGNLEVRVQPCGTALCGTVARVIANQSMSRPGEAMSSDAQPAKQGMVILSDFTPSASETGPDGQRLTTEWRGRIFNRENGKTYDCLMSVGPGGELKLHGYVGLPVFGRTQAWQRVAEASQ
ncbi:MAG: DUF2147 domain-containing protein [Rubrivivax sp.]|nr:MAG: DUF2147 domain-containing protein [Rubrivivax sp.]